MSDVNGASSDPGSTTMIRDWGAIKAGSKLIALTDNSSTGYFLYKGRPMGFEYELLKAFADAHDLDLEIKLVRDMDKLFNRLTSGEADIAAANLTITRDRMNLVNFTLPLLQTRQVLVQRSVVRNKKIKLTSNNELIRNPLDLAGKKVYVRKHSSFFQRLSNLSEETGNKIRIVEAPGHYETEMLISMVSRGEIDYTVADENIAMVNKTFYSNLDISTPISFPQEIAWAVRKDSPGLHQVINDWLADFKKTRRFRAIYNRYFHEDKSVSTKAGSRYNPASGVISQYDSIIELQAKRLGWDWRLLASLIYQESHFNHEARSWAGATGIMQMMPATAKAYGIDTTECTPAEQVRAGTSFLIRLNKMWSKSIKNEEERRKFVMASYNVGPGHVIDARNLARKYGKSDTTWKGVSVFLLLKSQPRFYQDPVVKSGYCRGSEPFRYVNQILERYNHYRNLAS